jgi:4-hydroxybenzoate polyprenyltransferase
LAAALAAAQLLAACQLLPQQCASAVALRTAAAAPPLPEETEDAADAEADAAAGKKTIAVRLGAASAGRASALMLNVASLAAAIGSLAGKPSAALVAIAIGVTLGPSIRAAKAWDGVDAAGLSVLKGALRKSVQGAWIAAALGFTADRWLS